MLTLEEIIEPCIIIDNTSKFELISLIKNELNCIYPECYLTEELESFRKHQLKYLWQILSSSGFNDNEKKTIFDTSFEKFKSESYKPKKYTIEDLKKGKVGIEYKGDSKRLINILKKAFKKEDTYPSADDVILDIGDVFYATSKSQNYSWHRNALKTDRIKIWISENEIQL